MCWKVNTQPFTFLLEQEAAFRKVVQATMVRDRQHGPVVELNRIQVHQKCMHLDCFFTSYFFPLSVSQWEGVFQTAPRDLHVMSFIRGFFFALRVLSVCRKL